MDVQDNYLYMKSTYVSSHRVNIRSLHRAWLNRFVLDHRVTWHLSCTDSES